MAPLEDCYRPDLVPTDDECRAEHSERPDIVKELKKLLDQSKATGRSSTKP